MKNLKLFLSSALLLASLIASSAYAVCPICTVLVGAGIGLSRWLGVDDTISGLWIGGFTMSLVIWTVQWLNKKNIRFKGRKILVTLFYYSIVLIPLQLKGVVGHPLNQMGGMDKLLLGILLGSFFFMLGNFIYSTMKENNNRAPFPYSKVVFPVVPLIVLTGIFYWLTR